MLLLDLEIPEVDGPDVFDTLRESGSDVLVSPYLTRTTASSAPSKPARRAISSKTRRVTRSSTSFGSSAKAGCSSRRSLSQGSSNTSIEVRTIPTPSPPRTRSSSPYRTRSPQQGDRLCPRHRRAHGQAPRLLHPRKSGNWQPHGSCVERRPAQPHPCERITVHPTSSSLLSPPSHLRFPAKLPSFPIS